MLGSYKDACCNSSLAGIFLYFLTYEYVLEYQFLLVMANPPVPQVKSVKVNCDKVPRLCKKFPFAGEVATSVGENKYLN